jgi:antitoxin MazE
MQAVIKKWGNSPALRLSSAIMKSAKLNVDQEVTIHIQRGKIVIEPSTQSEFVLDDLIAQISKENLHTEVNFGSPVGREVW